MPSCYLVALCSGSSLDQQSNNVTLFNLVEQINVPPDAPPPPPGAVVPIELHAYWRVNDHELDQTFDTRFALVSLDTQLEAFSDVITHQTTTPRFRTRTMGMPVPPTTGAFELRVDWRRAGSDGWHRDPYAWPLTVAQNERKTTETMH